MEEIIESQIARLRAIDRELMTAFTDAELWVTEHTTEVADFHKNIFLRTISISTLLAECIAEMNQIKRDFIKNKTMAKFIKLHQNFPSHQEVYINAELIQAIYPAIKGASIYMNISCVYTDMYDHEIIHTKMQSFSVDETAEEILALINN